MQQGGGFGRKGADASPATRIGVPQNRGGFGKIQSHRIDEAIARNDQEMSERDRLRAQLIAEVRADGLTARNEAPRYHEASGDAYAAAKAKHERDKYYGYSEGETGFGQAKLERSVAIAYLLWFFFGGFSAHRFYLGATHSAIVQASFFFVSLALIATMSAFSMLGAFLGAIWAFWVLIDLFRIPAVHARFCRQ